MQETHEQKPPQDIISLLKEYVTTRTELVRLSVIERLTVVTARLITSAVIVVAGILTFLFASLTLAFYLGEVLHSYAAGFGLVALIYLILALIVAFTKEKYLNKYLQDFMVKIIFKKKKK